MKTYIIKSNFLIGKYAITFIDESNKEVQKDFITKNQMHNFLFNLIKQGYKRSYVITK